MPSRNNNSKYRTMIDDKHTHTHTHTHTHKDATKAIGIGRQVGREMTCKIRLSMMIMMTHCNLKGLFN